MKNISYILHIIRTFKNYILHRKILHIISLSHIKNLTSYIGRILHLTSSPYIKSIILENLTYCINNKKYYVLNSNNLPSYIFITHKKIISYIGKNLTSYNQNYYTVKAYTLHITSYISITSKNLHRKNLTFYISITHQIYCTGKILHLISI